jgi:hypothetical protein
VQQNALPQRPPNAGGALPFIAPAQQKPPPVLPGTNGADPGARPKPRHDKGSGPFNSENDLKQFEGVSDEGDPVRQIVIDTSDAATLTVYVAAFTT